MRELHGRIQKQAQVPFRRAFEIAWKNIRVRLFLSLLVTSGIILALAFLTHILCSDALQQSVLAHGPPELLDRLQKQGVLTEPDPEDPTAEADARAAAGGGDGRRGLGARPRLRRPCGKF